MRTFWERWKKAILIVLFVIEFYVVLMRLLIIKEPFYKYPMYSTSTSDGLMFSLRIFSLKYHYTLPVVESTENKQYLNNNLLFVQWTLVQRYRIDCNDSKPSKNPRVAAHKHAHIQSLRWCVSLFFVYNRNQW